MKVISFNVNSIRQRIHQLEALIANHQPDIIGLQETKVSDDEFPVAAIEAMGYQVSFHGQKTHYGVAIMSKQTPTAVWKGFPHDDADSQRRIIGAEFDSAFGKLTVVNGYFPQGESREHPVKFPNKQKFYSDLHAHIEGSLRCDQPVILMGDMNVSLLDCDIGIGEDNRKRWLKSGKCSFLPEEREWLQKLHDWGFTDTFRKLHPDVNDQFSWFDYRSRGFERDPKRGLRIDLILATAPLLSHCTDAGIDYDIRAMEKPSDHCPVWASFG